MKKVGHEMTLTERMYLPAITKGLSLTFRHLLGKKITMQYPEETWTKPSGYRGLHKLTKDDKGRPKCVLVLHVRHGLSGGMHRHRGRGSALGGPREASQAI